ncbi:sulfotransferase 6B1-like [Bufo gargarizans]|uniref:sulfotransferase 6B1-like n=1 Tax=Bufo gargarizans TaxID=30331 RepID=UPI001CF25C3F|nr:sulfotransferase 6B1-like [Bufo gargarizans]
MEIEFKYFEEFKKVIDAAENIPKEDLLFTYNGVIYPTSTCDVDTFKTIETFEAREEDLMLVAYPKCALFELYHINQKKLFIFQKLKVEPSPRFLGSHLKYDNIPQSFFDKKVKMLVVFRNPKDTAVSLFQFYNNNPALPTYNSWDEFFPDFMAGKVCLGTYFDHAVACNKHLDDDTILLTIFEDMKEDLEGTIKKISEFYGISITEEQLKKIAEQGTFKSMKENSGKTHGDYGKIVFRKGEVGDWKNYFSEAQSQEMDAKFDECLAGTKLGEKLKYNVYCKW